MGLSNKVVFFSGYRKIKQFQVDTDIGKFDCTLLKEKCMNKFCIKAKQISVKFDGTEWPADKETYKLVFPPTHISSRYNDVEPKIKEFKIKRFRYHLLMHSHMNLLYSCLDFKCWLKDTASKPVREDIE